MERFSKIKPNIKTGESLAVTLPVPPLFQDHHVQNRPVFPAVEAMETVVSGLVDAVSSDVPLTLLDIRFDKFYFIEKETDLIRGVLKVKRPVNAPIQAIFCTERRFGASGIKRTLEHARLALLFATEPVVPPPVDRLAALTGACHTVLPDAIYKELVPFGPAYQNIKAPLMISPDGALAMVSSPTGKDNRKDLRLGSPYPLDAAFHAACVWSQFYKGVVAFPVGVEKRMVLKKTRMDKTYVARVFPVKTQTEPFVFDIWIFDRAGAVYEMITGVHMKDISGGRTLPPRWITNRKKDPDLKVLKDHCKGLVLVEKAAIAPFAPLGFSPLEKKRFSAMTEKRAKSYTAARLALKRLCRKLSGDDCAIAAKAIETVKENGPEPVCLVPKGFEPVFCSVSHNNRFAVAVAKDGPVGVDVETISEKPVCSRHLFMAASEQALVENSALDEKEAATRIWSAKEAVAKAMGIFLDRAWQRTRVVEFENNTSHMVLDENTACTVIHERIGDNLFTLTAG